MTAKALSPGDSAPWFDAHALANTDHNLGVLAGRWVALCFVHDLAEAAVIHTLATIIAQLGRFFNDDHVVFYAVLTAPPAIGGEMFTQASHRGMGFMTDYDGAITRLYGADDRPQMIVLDPMLRVEKILPLGSQGAAADEVCGYLAGLPKIDDWAGVPLTAPALIVPHVFEPAFCQHLIGLYEQTGGKDSGFMLDKDGKTMTVINHDYKKRFDMLLDDPVLCEQIRDRVARRLVPMMERFFGYRPTRMDRYLVSCYDAETGGHFARHRDNVNAGARHRRFAASLNLNHDYEGCDLFFPEFGRRLYRAPLGGAIVFATGALHQVTPVTRGKRYAFVPFFYGEDEARLRMANNAHLHAGEGLYKGDRDRLLPEAGTE